MKPLKTINNKKPLFWKQDYPYYRSIWNRLVVWFLTPALLLALLFGTWCYYFAKLDQAQHVTGIAVFIIGEIFILFSVFLSANYLVRKMEIKRENIYMLDRKLLQMSRMASATQLSKSFFRELKDVLSNIDVAAVSAQESIGGNRLRETGESLVQIRSEASGINKAIDKFIAFTRPPGSRWLITEIDIHQIIYDLLEILKDVFFLRSIRVHREFQKNLPVIHSNLSRLHQIFQNLFLTVIADIADDADITLKTVGISKGIQVIMTYPSVYFDKKVIEKLFDPACSIQASEPGPWLALCTRHVLRLNGTMHASETPEKRLSFIVELPFRIHRPEK